MARHVRIFVIALAVTGTLILVTQTALAKDKGGFRPGWGNGDKNHIHVGPPGRSVHPDPEHEDDRGGHESEHHGKAGGKGED